MKLLNWVLLLSLTINCPFTYSQKAQFATQSTTLERKNFFADDEILDMTIATDFRRMQKEKVKGVYQPATATVVFSNGSTITEQVELYGRGEFRRKNCRMPGIMINFKSPETSKLSGLKKLKLVCGCAQSTKDEQHLLVEYLAYKIYNILTPMSFKPKLVKITYNDVANKLKPYAQYAFFIEDVDDMAGRNGCVEVEDIEFGTEQTNREQTTLLAIFQYMIGNLDWAVPVYHNIKLIQTANNTHAAPYAVPYDFDYSGFVNPYYAIPNERFGIEKMTDRVYWGFPRTVAEVQNTLNIFRAKKDAILNEIKNFELLEKNYKNNAIDYIESFYAIIDNDKRVENLFVDNARRQ